MSAAVGIFRGEAPRGRHLEFARLRIAAAEAAAGSGSLVVLRGEAGAGKTHLVEAFLASCCEEFRVGVSHGMPGPGRPPLWTWRDLAGQISGLEGLVDPLMAVADATIDRDRFEIFDDLSRRWLAATSQTPTVLVLEDLQHADSGTLELLGELARSLHRVSLLVIASLRPAEFAKLSNGSDPLPKAELYDLEPLSEDSMTAILEHDFALHLDDLTRQALLEAAEGNPMVLCEAASLLHAGLSAGEVFSSGLPRNERIRGLLQSRLAEVSAPDREVLQRVALGGLLLPSTMWGDAYGCGRDEFEQVLGRALRAGVLRDVRGEIGFRNPILASLLIDNLAPDDAARLHAQFAEILGFSNELGERYAQAAYHALRAGTAIDPSLATSIFSQAGERARRLTAWAEAAEYFRAAISAMRRAGSTFDARACAWNWLRLGECLRDWGKTAESLEAFREVRRMSEGGQLGAELSLRAAIAHPPNRVLGGMDHRAVGRLRAGLSEQGGSLSPGIRARASIYLARELWWGGEISEIERLANDAEEIARGSGDSRLLAWVLEVRGHVLDRPERLAEAAGVAAEVASLAEAAGNRPLQVRACRWELHARLRQGDRDGAERIVEKHAQLAEGLGFALHHWWREVWRNSLAILDGRFADAERGIAVASELESNARAPGITSVGSGQSIHLRHEQGQSEQLIPLVEAFIEMNRDAAGFRNLDSGVALFSAEAGDLRASRQAFERLGRDGFRGLDRFSREMTLRCAAEACVILEDRARAEQLLGVLKPYAGTNLVFDSAILGVLGPADRHIGQLSTLVGDHDEAEAKLRSAETMIDALRSPPLRARWLLDWARHCEAVGSVGAAKAAREEAYLRASGLGMKSLAGQIRNSPSESSFSAISGTDPVEGNPCSFERQGAFWQVSFGGKVTLERHGVGMQYLATLLRYPGREFHVLDLISQSRPADPVGEIEPVALEPGFGVSAFTGPGGGLDPGQRRAYSARLGRIEEELQHADALTSTRLREERQLLAEEVAAAIGARGANRSPDVEKARTSVQRAVRRAAGRIRADQEALGQHLDSAIRTGTYCSYQPDPRVPIQWAVSG